MRKVLLVFGTRPEAIKMAPLIRELKSREDEFQVKVCVTGQHREMLDQVLEFFSIVPDYDLHVMEPGQTLFGVTARILERIEAPILAFQPDTIVVQGDTTSALVGALAGYYMKIDVAHIEAGLRSGDMYSPFPEEMNRVLIGRIAKFHFAPTERSARALRDEGINPGRVHVVGNTVVDALILGLQIVKDNQTYISKELLNITAPDKKIIVVTGHRRESFGEGFEHICGAIKEIAAKNPDVEFIYPVHLNPNVQEPVRRILGGISSVHLIEPLNYPSLIWLMEKCYLILTDSGGIQEEAPTLGKPVLVMREVTERQEGIDKGTAKLVGVNSSVITKEVQELLNSSTLYERMAMATNPYGDGTAAKQITDILEQS